MPSLSSQAPSGSPAFFWPQANGPSLIDRQLLDFIESTMPAHKRGASPEAHVNQTLRILAGDSIEPSFHSLCKGYSFTITAAQPELCGVWTLRTAPPLIVSLPNHSDVSILSHLSE